MSSDHPSLDAYVDDLETERDRLRAENQRLEEELEVALQVVLQLQGELAGDAE